MSHITPESAQRISALVDGQLQGQELAQVLHELGRQGQARAQWDAYHVIGQSLRGAMTPVKAPMPGLSVASASA